MGQYWELFKKVARIVNPAIMSEELKVQILASEGVLDRAVNNIVQKGEACVVAKNILTVHPRAMEYVGEHHSSIGTDIHLCREERCGAWVRNYTRWLAKNTRFEILPDIPKPDLPDIPKIPFPILPSLPEWKVPSPPDWKLPSLPSFTGAKIIGLFVILIALLIALGYSGLGKATGSHLEK